MLIDVERVLRAEYKSAGQTELKLWLAELSKRDGVLPMGRTRVPAPSDGDNAAKPMFIDESSDLSAGTSVELSDIDGSSSPTAVAVTPITGPAPAPPSPGMVPVRARIGEGLPPVPADLREILGPHGATTVVAPPRKAATPAPMSSITASVNSSMTEPAAGRPLPAAPVAAPAAFPPPPASVGSPAAPSPTPVAAAPSGDSGPASMSSARRPARRSRVGMGFLLGAVCMLGAVFGIRWLAQWAGREGVGPSSWYEGSPDARRNEAGAAAPGSAAPSVSNSAPAAAVGAGGAGPAAVAGRSGGAAVETAPSAQAAEGSDAGSGAAPSPDASPAATELAEDDEDRLLGRVRPDAAAVIGEDEAEVEAPPHKGKGATTEAKAGDERTSTSRPEPERAKDKGKAARAAAAKNQPVQIRITTSPLGAVVRSKKQVLGRTPLAIRFKPGSTYELTFVKSGYITNSRRLAVSVGKPQSISVAMKKAPAPRRSFFGR